MFGKLEGTLRRIVCVGLGYSARAIAARLDKTVWSAVGTARAESDVGTIREGGLDGIQFDGTAASPDLAAAIRSATHLVVSAPPNGDGDPLLRHHRDDVAAAGRLEWVCYLSTIGVYGDRGGDWVSETDEPRPSSERSRWRLAAEREWLASCGVSGRRLVILRLGGIYGPGRSTIDGLLAGTAKRIVKPGQIFNRIHVDDIANAAIASMDVPHGAGVFNVVDDEPSPPQDVVTFAARLIGREPPPEIAFEDAALSPMGRSFYAESKRVRNDLMKRVLGIEMIYPTYREGLTEIARTMRLS